MLRHWQRFTRRFQPRPTKQAGTARKTLNELLEGARRAQYAENYEQALHCLDEAARLAARDFNKRAEVDITLSRADILITRHDLEQAEAILLELREESENRHHRAPLAYTIVSLGVIAQQRGNWEQARDFYEQARQIAGEVRAEGAGGRAAAHLADTYLHEENFSYAIYLYQDALPRLRRSGDRELLGYFQGQLGTALLLNGQGEQGIQAMKAGLEAALTIKHRAQMRHLYHLLGKDYLQRGNPAQAQQHLQEALALAADTPSTERAALLCELCKASLASGDPQAAQTFATQGLDLAQQLGDQDMLRRAQGTLGLAQLAAGDPQAALPNLQAATAGSHRKDADYFTIQRRIAHILQEQQQTTEAAAILEAIIREASTTYPVQAADAGTQLALIQQQERQFRAALETLQQAASRYEAAGLSTQVTRAWCDIGALYLDMGDGRMAQREYDRALERLSIIHDPDHRGAVLANVANAYSELGDIESAEEFYKEAITLAQQTGQVSIEARRRGNYGRLLALSSRPRQALIELQEAWRQSSELHLKTEAALQSGSIALALAANDNHAAALEQYQTADEQLAALPDPVWRAQFRAHRADSLLTLGKPEEAQADFAAALQIGQSRQQVALTIHALLGLAQVALIAGDSSRAAELLQQAEPLAKRAGLRRLIARWHEVHAGVLRLQQQPERAEEAQQEAARLRGILRMPPLPEIQRG